MVNHECCNNGTTFMIHLFVYDSFFDVTACQSFMIYINQATCVCLLF